MSQDMLYCIALYLAVGVGSGAGKYILANVEDNKIDTKDQHNNIRFGDKDPVLSHKIILFSVRKITAEKQVFLHPLYLVSVRPFLRTKFIG